jgi:hypothetical protein
MHFESPAIDERHQAVALRCRHETAGLDQLSVFVTQSEQQFVPGLTGRNPADLALAASAAPLKAN